MPGFSVTADALWCYPVLRRHGITTDISVVPARRDHGGIVDFPRDPFILDTVEGEVTCFPVSVMTVAGRRIPFSGGGYLRLFPLAVIRAGFRQNHAVGRPGMSYIHPREVNPAQPRLPRPPLWDIAGSAKYLKYYVNMRSTRPKLAALLRGYRFGTVGEVLKLHPPTKRLTLRQPAGASTPSIL